MFHRQKIPNNLQQGRTSGKWLRVESIAVKLVPPFFQVNASKLRRLLDTVDLEEHTDCVNGTVLKSFMSATFDRQGLMVAAPADLRT